MLQDDDVLKTINEKDFLGFRPIEHATAAGSVEVVEVLLAAEADVQAEQKYDSVLHIALDREEVAADLVAVLIAGGADIEHQGTGGVTPLLRALSKGNQPAVEVLLEAGADVDVENNHGVNAVSWAQALSQRFNNTNLHDVLLAAKEKKLAENPLARKRQMELDAAAAKVGYVEMDARDKKPMG